MALTIIGWLFTVFVFGKIGWIAASQRTRRSGVKTFVTLTVVATIGILVGGNVILFGIEKFWILLNWATVSACAGAGFRLALTNRQLKRIESE